MAAASTTVAPEGIFPGVVPGDNAISFTHQVSMNSAIITFPAVLAIDTIAVDPLVYGSTASANVSYTLLMSNGFEYPALQSLPTSFPLGTTSGLPGFFVPGVRFPGGQYSSFSNPQRVVGVRAIVSAVFRPADGSREITHPYSMAWEVDGWNSGSVSHELSGGIGQLTYSGTVTVSPELQVVGAR